MNFPNVLKFPEVCIRELAMASCVIAQLDYLVYFSFLLHVWLWQITSSRRTYFCFFVSMVLWLSNSFRAPASTCSQCWDWVALGQCQQDPAEVCPCGEQPHPTITVTEPLLQFLPASHSRGGKLLQCLALCQPGCCTALWPSCSQGEHHKLSPVTVLRLMATGKILHGLVSPRCCVKGSQRYFRYLMGL